MKKSIVCAIVALVALMMPALAKAQKPVNHECKRFGVSLIVPDNAEVTASDDDVYMLATPDGRFYVNLLNFNMEENSDEDIAKAWRKLTNAAKIDFDSSDELKLDTRTISGTYKIDRVGDDASACVGFTFVKGTYNSFIVTLSAGDEYSRFLYGTLKSFNATRIK